MNVPAFVEDVPVNKLAPCSYHRVVHLVEEQVPQPIVDKGILAKFHVLREVGLAAADDYGAGICCITEIGFLMIGRGLVTYTSWY
jgi:hypothetical protein